MTGTTPGCCCCGCCGALTEGDCWTNVTPVEPFRTNCDAPTGCFASCDMLTVLCNDGLDELIRVWERPAKLGTGILWRDTVGVPETACLAACVTLPLALPLAPRTVWFRVTTVLFSVFPCGGDTVLEGCTSWTIWPSWIRISLLPGDDIATSPTLMAPVCVGETCASFPT